MRLISITAENFKGIEKANVSLAKSPVNNVFTLVGINESGKTTMLEAINSFEYNDEKDLTKISNAILPSKDDLIPIKYRTNFNGNIKTVFELELNEKDKKDLNEYILGLGYILMNDINIITVEQIYNYKNSKFDNSSYKWGMELICKPKKSRTKYGAKLEGEEWNKVVNFMKQKMPRILYFPTILFDLPDKIYLNNLKPDDYKGEFYRLVIQDILDSLDDSLNIKEHLVDRIVSNSATDKDNVKQICLQIGRKLSEEILKKWSMVLTNKAKRINVDVDKDEKGVFIEFKIEGDDGFFHLSERSLGFRWFFVFLLLTQFRGYRKSEDKHIIFLFDEPAANLSRKAQKQLIKSLEKISDKCTIIYTTHSQHLINPNWLEGAYVVTNDAYNDEDEDFVASDTNIKIYRYRDFVSEFPQNVSYFQPILDVLEYVPNELEMCDNVIILEGKNDYYVLNYFFKTILNREDISLVPGMSCTNVDSLISLYSGWGKEFKVLLDSDEAAKSSKKRYEEKFGSIVDKKIFMLNDVDKKWNKKNMESIIPNTERYKIQLECFPESKKYTKNMYNKAIQELLMCNRKIDISEDVLEKFKLLYDFLKTTDEN